MCPDPLCHINPCRLNRRVPEYICQKSQIFLYRIKTPCEQVAQIVWKDLFPVHFCLLADLLHLVANITAVQWFPLLVWKTGPLRMD